MRRLAAVPACRRARPWISVLDREGSRVAGDSNADALGLTIKPRAAIRREQFRLDVSDF